MKLSNLALKFKEYCGIDFTTNLVSLEQKVSKRLMELGLTLEEYMIHLQMDQKEWEKLLEHITINETYFFREFNLLLDEFQNLIKKQKDKQINVWCIPCSTGEEAYSLAILAKEVQLSTGNQVRIVASDLNKKVLEQAKTGFYQKNSLSFRRFPEDKEYIKSILLRRSLAMR